VSPLVVAFAAFVFAVAAGLAGVLWVAAAPERPEARVRARIGALRRTGAHAPAGSVPLLKEEPLGAASWPQRFLAGSPLLAHLDDLLKRSALHVAAGTIVLASVAIALVTPFLLWALRVPASLAVLGLAACVLPYAYVRRRVARRRRRFLEQMPDGLDTISQGLQAGLGLGHAQVFLAEEAPEPMKSEFSIFLQEMNLGLPLRDAVSNLERRMPLHEVRLFSTALLVQREVGGSLSEVLVRLGDVIRDRFRVEQEIRSLTAQNRMTAWVVCSLPIVLGAAMFLLNPKFMSEVTGHPVGVTMLTMAGISWLIGAFVFWRMLKIHV
jgi:tight adherence protein B